MQQVLSVKSFHQNGECEMQAVQKFQTIFGRNEGSCEFTLCRLVTKFETTAVFQFVENIFAQAVSSLKLNHLFQTLSLVCIQ